MDNALCFETAHEGVLGPRSVPCVYTRGMVTHIEEEVILLLLFVSIQIRRRRNTVSPTGKEITLCDAYDSP